MHSLITPKLSDRPDKLAEILSDIAALNGDTWLEADEKQGSTRVSVPTAQLTSATKGKFTTFMAGAAIKAIGIGSIYCQLFNEMKESLHNLDEVDQNFEGVTRAIFSALAKSTIRLSGLKKMTWTESQLDPIDRGADWKERRRRIVKQRSATKDGSKHLKFHIGSYNDSLREKVSKILGVIAACLQFTFHKTNFNKLTMEEQKHFYITISKYLLCVFLFFMPRYQCKLFFSLHMQQSINSFE